MAEWIRPQEKLPEPFHSVLITFSHAQYGTKGKRVIDSVGIGFHTGKKWSNVVGAVASYREVTVLAWMPMPDKYTEVHEEQIN